MAIRILVADDQLLVRQGLRMFLSLDPDLQIVGEAADGYEVIHLAKLLKPDVILMDLMMPNMDGIEATTGLRELDGSMTIIGLSHSQNPALIEAIIKAGANLFLSKEIRTEELIIAIKSSCRT